MTRNRNNFHEMIFSFFLLLLTSTNILPIEIDRVINDRLRVVHVDPAMCLLTFVNGELKISFGRYDFFIFGYFFHTCNLEKHLIKFTVVCHIFLTDLYNFSYL